MTRLSRLRVHRVTSPLVRPFVTAVRSADAIDVMLVEAIDSDGRSGWGEAAASWRVTGESPESISAAVLGPLSAALEGTEVADASAIASMIRSALVGNAAARSAVECAVSDLRAQATGETLARSFGADPTVETVRTDMTLSIASTAELVAQARALSDNGFSCIKVKAAAGDDIVAALVALRSELGTASTLRIDANQAWAPDEAIRVIHAIEDAGVGIELVEQPVESRDLDGLARVTTAVDTPILADESVWTTLDLLEVVRRRAADLVNIKLAKTGGPTEALGLATAARGASMRVVVGCMMESSVGVAAATALAAAVRPDAVHDLDGGLWLRTAPVEGGMHYDGDRAVLAPAPGLGITGLAERGAA